MDKSAYHQLENAGIISDIFDLAPNNLRSGVTVKSKAVATCYTVESMFAWRVARKIHSLGHL